MKCGSPNVRTYCIPSYFFSKTKYVNMSKIISYCPETNYSSLLSPHVGLSLRDEELYTRRGKRQHPDTRQHGDRARLSPAYVEGMQQGVVPCWDHMHDGGRRVLRWEGGCCGGRRMFWWGEDVVVEGKVLLWVGTACSHPIYSIHGVILSVVDYAIPVYTFIRNSTAV